MKWLKGCRWIGASLLIISCLLMTYLLLPVFFSDIQDNGPVVLQVSSDTVDFPENDYRFLFAKLGLRYEKIDREKLQSNDVQEEIEKAILKEDKQPIILFSHGDLSEVSLRVASAWTQVVGVILLTPEFETPHLLSDYGRLRPNVPVGIFGGKNESGILGYEQLSGEDATILPGQVQGGFLRGETHFSSNGDRYFRSWDLFSGNSFLNVYMPYFPQVQLEITTFIANFILTAWQVDSQTCRLNILDLHGVKILSITLMIAGILLFFSSFGKESEEKIYDENSGYPEMIQRDVYALFRAKGFFIGLSLILFCFFLGIMFLFAPSQILIVLGCWPIFLYSAQIIAGRKMLTPSIAEKKTWRLGNISIVFLFILLLVFSLFLKNLQFFSISFLNSENRLVFLILIPIFLLGSQFFKLSIDNYVDDLTFALDLRKPTLSRAFQISVAAVPHVLALIVGLIRGEISFCVTVCIMFLALALHFWIGRIFRKASSSLLIPTLASSIVYTILVFG